MVESEKIIQLIFNTIDELNEQYAEEQRLAKSIDTVLFGKGGNLDSIGIVTLIIATEQKLEEIFGISLILADEKAMSQERSPFRTIGSLADYIGTLIEESTDV